MKSLGQQNEHLYLGALFRHVCPSADRVRRCFETRFPELRANDQISSRTPPWLLQDGDVGIDVFSDGGEIATLPSDG
jgi:hypothetical protein